MRNTWIAIIGVFTFTLFAGTTFATSPIVDDIPDFRLLTPSETVDDFDLKDYVSDFDDAVSSLIWSITGASGFDGQPCPATVSPNGLLDIAAMAAPTNGTVGFQVDDATQTALDYSVIKFAGISLIGPGLSQDNTLTADSFKKSWVVEIGKSITTPDIDAMASVTPDELSVSIADMDGALLDGANTSSAASGDLIAALNPDGTLTLSAASVPGTLSGAYRVGVKAKVTGSPSLAGANDNWDGMEILASMARFPMKKEAVTMANLDQFGNLTGVATGDLPATLNAMRALTTPKPYWVASVVSGSATAQVVDTGIPASSWATDGEAIRVQLNAADDLVFLQSELFTDIAPGETVSLSMNMTTDLPAGSAVPNVLLFMGNRQALWEAEGLSLAGGAGTAGEEPVAVGSTWRTVKATFTADEEGAAVADGVDTINFYSLGYQLQIVVSTGYLAAGDLPVNVYIDNIRVYRDDYDINKALGATGIDVAGTPANFGTSAIFDGTLESATDLMGTNVGLVEFTAGGDAVIDTIPANNAPTHDGSKSLKMWIPTANGRSTTLVELVMQDVSLDASGAGGDDNRGDGIFAATLWYKTDGTTLADVPDIMFCLADLQFKVVPWKAAGGASAPCAATDPDWDQVILSAPRYAGGRLKVFAIVTADAYWLTDFGQIPDSWGTFGSTPNNPGYESDAAVYIDDIQIHKYMDTAVMFDRSVFPVAD